jgi:hypothetical protein
MGTTKRSLPIRHRPSYSFSYLLSTIYCRHLLSTLLYRPLERTAARRRRPSAPAVRHAESCW